MCIKFKEKLLSFTNFPLTQILLTPSPMAGLHFCFVFIHFLNFYTSRPTCDYRVNFMKTNFKISSFEDMFSGELQFSAVFNSMMAGLAHFVLVCMAYICMTGTICMARACLSGD